MQATPVHAGGNVPTLTADFSGASRPGHDHDSASAYIVAAKPAKKTQTVPTNSTASTAYDYDAGTNFFSCPLPPLFFWIIGSVAPRIPWLIGQPS